MAWARVELSKVFVLVLAWLMSGFVLAQNDEDIASRVQAVLDNTEAEELAEADITVFRGTVLLTGQVSDEEIKRQASTSIAFAQTRALRVVNELVVSDQAVDISADEALLARVESAIADGFPDLHEDVQAVVHGGTVFLLGTVSRDQGMEVATVASRINGVAAIRMVYDFTN